MNLIKKVVAFLYYRGIRNPLSYLCYKILVVFPVFLSRRSLKSCREGGPILLIVVGFNNPQLIQIQIRLFRNFIKDKYVLLIADNSSDKNMSTLIYKKCLLEKVDYIKVPRQNMFKNSNSHALALNWVFQKIVKHSQFNIVGLLDHDIFPIRDIFLSDRIKNKLAFGVLHHGSYIDIHDNFIRKVLTDWYLWPGYAFYNLDELKKYKVDFRTSNINNKHFDTGGRNWYSIYSKVPIEKFSFVAFDNIKIGDGNSRQNNYVDIIDESWLHLINGSNWYHEFEEQTSIKKKFMSFIESEKTDNIKHVKLNEIIPFFNDL
jgi:hypothetical protein